MDTAFIKTAITNQYHAALDMLQHTIEKCHDDLWLDTNYTNPTWHICYHTLFFYRLYLYQHLDDHTPWEYHRKGAQDMERREGRKPVEPYSKKDILQFLEHCRKMTDSSVSNMDLGHPESGFHWYKVSKLEHQIVNIRHLQHHVAQLQDRLRNNQNEGINWVRSRGQVKK